MTQVYEITHNMNDASSLTALPYDIMSCNFTTRNFIPVAYFLSCIFSVPFVVSVQGCTDLHFVDASVKINGQCYTVKFSPTSDSLSHYFTFHRDSAPAHSAQETVDLLKRDTGLHPAVTNSRDLNPVDCCFKSEIN